MTLDYRPRHKLACARCGHEKPPRHFPPTGGPPVRGGRGWTCAKCRKRAPREREAREAHR